MDINKIYNALQSLPLPIEQKTLLIEAFTSGEQKVQQPENLRQEDTRIENILYSLLLIILFVSLITPGYEKPLTPLLALGARTHCVSSRSKIYI